MKQEPNDGASAPESSPYAAPRVVDVPPQFAKKAGPIAIFVGIVLAGVLGVMTFGLSFFFTCLGVSSMGGDGEFGMVIVVGISGLTAVAAFIFSFWGFLKIVEGFKSR